MENISKVPTPDFVQALFGSPAKFPACGMAETDRVGGKFSAISLPANSKPNFVEGKATKKKITEKTVDL